MDENEQTAIADEFAARLLATLEDATARGLDAGLVYNAAVCAALSYGARRSPMASQAADLRAVADRLDREDNCPRRPAH